MGVKTIDLNANFFSFFCTFSDSYFTYLWPSRRAKFIHRMRERHLLCELMTLSLSLAKKMIQSASHECDSSTYKKKTDIRIEAKKEAILLLLVERISFIVLPKTVSTTTFFLQQLSKKFYLKISVDCTALFILPSSAHEPYRRNKKINHFTANRFEISVVRIN